MDATEACARCGAHVCLACLGYGGACVLCVACASAMRRRGDLARGVVALIVAAAGALLGFAVLQVPWTPAPDGAEIYAMRVKQTLRSCNGAELDLLVSSLVMGSDDRRAIALAEAFAERCDLPPEAAGMVARARARLAPR